MAKKKDRINCNVAKMEETIGGLIRKYPEDKPKEILEKYQKVPHDLTPVTVQKIAGLKKRISTEKPPKEKVLLFKNKRTHKTTEYREGDTVPFFTIQGSTKKFSLSDFLALVERSCGEMVEVNPNSSITEIPIQSITAQDLMGG